MTGAGKTSVMFKAVSSAYFDVLGIPIVRGRAFTECRTRPRSRGHRVGIGGARVVAQWQRRRRVVPARAGFTRAATRRASSRSILMRPSIMALMQPRTVTVVGVARDVPGFRITDVKEAGVFLPTSLDVAKTSVVARVQGPPNLARETLLEHLTNVDPNMGNIITMQTVARLETFFLQIAFWVSLILGGLALLLTVSGLFSVLSYLVEQRTREIGVRMALGASSQNVTQLMLAQTTRPVMYGLIAGAGCAAALAAAVIATPVGAYISQIVHVTDPVAYAVEPAGDHRRVPVGGVDPRRTRGQGRPDAHTAAGIGLRWTFCYCDFRRFLNYPLPLRSNPVRRDAIRRDQPSRLRPGACRTRRAAGRHTRASGADVQNGRAGDRRR